MEIVAHIEGLDNLTANLDKLSDNSVGYLVDALNITANSTRNDIMDKQRNSGAVDTGRMLGSWQITNANRQTMEAKVGIDQSIFPHYSADIEAGTNPHFPPPSALADWAARKLGDAQLAFAVAHKIAEHGTSGRHIFDKGTNNTRSWLEQNVQKALNKIKSGWGK